MAESRLAPLERLLTSLQFLLALLAAFTGWPLVGGAGHLELMGWYWKLGLSFAFAVAVCGAAAAHGASRRIWSSLVVTIVIAMGLVTYYVHLHEPDEEEEEPDVAALCGPVSGVPASPRVAVMPCSRSGASGVHPG